MNLKPNSRNLKCRKRNKPSSPNGQLLKLTKVSKKKNFHAGSWAWLLHPVASKVFIWDRLLWSECLFERGALATKACQAAAFKKEKGKKKKSQMLGLILQAWSGVLRKDIYQLFLDLNLSWKVSQFSIFACFSGKAISIVNSQFSLWIGSWSNRTVVDSYLSAWSLPSYLVMVLSPPELLSPLLGLCIWDLFLVMAWGWLAIEA